MEVIWADAIAASFSVKAVAMDSNYWAVTPQHPLEETFPTKPGHYTVEIMEKMEAEADHLTTAFSEEEHLGLSLAPLTVPGLKRINLYQLRLPLSEHQSYRFLMTYVLPQVAVALLHAFN